MDFTGERMIPEFNKGQQIYLEHMARYIFAFQFVKGKTVLDVACGSGYGAELMIRFGAEKVIGVDNSKEVIKYCQGEYPYKEIDFLVGDVTNIPVESNSIDTVVSFETLEHVCADDQIKFMSEIDRVLKKDGILVISTPNSLVFYSGSHFHLKELDPGEFSKILKEKFSSVEIYYQDVAESSFIFNAGGLKKDFLAENNSKLGSSKIGELIPEDSMYLLAVCSYSPILFVENSITLSEIKSRKIIPNDTNLYSAIIEKEKELFEIRNSLRWKIPNYFYKFYKKRIKKYIPKFIFWYLAPIFSVLNKIRKM